MGVTVHYAVVGCLSKDWIGLDPAPSTARGVYYSREGSMVISLMSLSLIQLLSATLWIPTGVPFYFVYDDDVPTLCQKRFSQYQQQQLDQGYSTSSDLFRFHRQAKTITEHATLDYCDLKTTPVLQLHKSDEKHIQNVSF